MRRVLQVLEAHHVPVDLIVGTSMGAIVGGLYAAGMSASELEALIEEIDWLDTFDDRIPRQDRTFRRKRDDDSYLVDNRPGLSGLHLEFPPGLLDGRKIDLMLKRYTLPVVTIRDFDALPIPYHAVAALATGAAVVLDHGDLAKAMRPSMSIPVVFTPSCEIEGRLLVDGGIRNNIPIDVARALGAEVIIAVDISTTTAGARRPDLGARPT